MKPLYKNNQGNAILAVVMATALIAIAYTTVIDSVIRYKAKVVSFQGDVDLRLSLHSTMDFVIFGIKQQYCFDDVLMQDANCDLKHPASVERLIMSVDQLNYIKAMIANGTIKDISNPNELFLKSISKKISFSNVSELHPLYVIFKNPKLNKIATGVEVLLERDNSLYVPKYGGEIYVNITVKLYGLKDDTKSKFNQSKLELKSKISIHPREVGSFALMIAKDLRLDKTELEMQTAGPGDIGFHQFVNAVDDAKKSPGLLFLSPVFVNQNIYMPNSKIPHYTSVTFADKVYMGNGSVYQGSSLYKPGSTGGISDRYWNSGNENFGGFLKGVENDGGLDKGLSVFGKVTSGAISNYDLMKKCIARTQSNVNNTILLNNNLTSSSQKFQRSSTQLISVQRLTVSNGDEFKYQKDNLDDSAATTWNQALASFYRKSTPNPGSLLTATVQLLSSNPSNNLSVQFDMSTDYKDASNDEYVELKTDFAKTFAATVKTQLDSQAAVVTNINKQLTNAKNAKADLLALIATPDQIAAVDKKINDAEKALADAKNAKTELLTKAPAPDQIAAADLKISDAEKALTEAISAKAALLAKNPTTLQLDNADKLITELEKLLATATASKSELTQKYADAKYKDDHPPVVKLYLNKVYKGSDQEKNKLDLNMVLSNEKSLIDKFGVPYNLSIKTKGYNLGYSNGESLLKDNDDKKVDNLNLEGFLNYIADGSFQLKNPLALSPTNSADATAATPEDVTDYKNLDQLCENSRDAQASQSFGSASYFTDFSATTRSSWNFAGGDAVDKDPTLDKITFDGTNASTAANASFQVRSIVGQCIIKSTALFITGFFTCDKLIIEARVKPLRIIGTFIVGKLSIDPLAYKAGIVWSSIYHPQAVFELRKMNILKPLPGGPIGENCSSFGANDINNPIWHPIPSVQFYSNRESCNVISLRERADPFRWTAVDPDCGLITGNSNTVCKHKQNRFHVFEHSRGESD